MRLGGSLCCKCRLIIVVQIEIGGNFSFAQDITVHDGQDLCGFGVFFGEVVLGHDIGRWATDKEWDEKQQQQQQQQGKKEQNATVRSNDGLTVDVRRVG